MSSYEDMRNERRAKLGKRPLVRYAPSLPNEVLRDIEAAEAMNKAVAADRMRAWQPGSVFSR